MDKKQAEIAAATLYYAAVIDSNQMPQRVTLITSGEDLEKVALLGEAYVKAHPLKRGEERLLLARINPADESFLKWVTHV